MNLADQLQAAQSSRESTALRYREWLASDQVPTEEALAFAIDALKNERRDDLPRGFRASESTFCHRRRMLGYTKVAERGPIEPRTQNIFDTGSYIHLKYQVAGLSWGFFKECEPPAINGLVRGYVDGVQPGGAPVEIKSINSNGYRRARTHPKYEHRHQVGHYAVALGADYGVLLYENKDTSDITEHFVEVDDRLLSELATDVEPLEIAIQTQTLPPVLPDCAQRKGTQFNYCPFREICLDVTDELVDEVGEW